MVDRSGGTPIYCSPEGLTSATPGISDLFSLGRVFTFLVMEDQILFYILTFFTIKNQSHLEFIQNYMSSFQIMNLIKEMTHIDKNKRIRIAQVKQRLTNMNIEILTKTRMASELTAQNQTDLLNDQYCTSLVDDLGKAEINDIQVKLMMRER